MTKELREALKELVFDTVRIGLPKDSVIVGDNLLSPARKKLLKENIGTYIDEAEEKFIALFDRYAAEREQQARIDELHVIAPLLGLKGDVNADHTLTKGDCWDVLVTRKRELSALKETTNE